MITVPWTSGRHRLFAGNRQPRVSTVGISCGIDTNFDSSKTRVHRIRATCVERQSVFGSPVPSKDTVRRDWDPGDLGTGDLGTGDSGLERFHMYVVSAFQADLAKSS